MTTSGQPVLTTQPEDDAPAWEFLIDTSKVSFDAIAVFAHGSVNRL